jgi:hypothetical protein
VLEDDLVADSLHDGIDGVAEGVERLAGEAAGAGFMAREGALVEEKNALAGAREVVGGGASGGTGADNEDVVGNLGDLGVLHGPLLV